jgi:hypothetical protein
MAVAKLKIILSHELPFLRQNDHDPSLLKIKACCVPQKLRVYEDLTRLSFYDLFALLETFI